MQPLWLCIHLGPLILQTLIALCIFQALDIADVNNFFPFWLSELQIALLGKASMQKICYISHRLSHYHHVRFACASSDVFQRELHNYTRQKQAWRLQICTIGNDALCVKEIIFPYQKENSWGKKGMFWKWDPRSSLKVRQYWRHPPLQGLQSQGCRSP